MPDLGKSLSEYFEQFRGKAAFRYRMQDAQGRDLGNNGDDLIEMGQCALLQRCGVEQTTDLSTADVIVIRGGGGLIEGYGAAFKVLHQAWAEHPDIPLVVFPSTFYYPNRNIAELLGPRSAEAVLFARDQVSFDHLKREHNLPPQCYVGLDHDSAFDLESEPLVTQWKHQLATDHILMVERGDVEHPGKSETFWKSDVEGRKPSLTRFLPQWLKQSVYPIRVALRGRRRTPFRARCESLMHDTYPELQHLPWVSKDLSDRSVCDMDGFCEQIARAAVVFTTRLHVGIYAAMLGKRTFLFEGAYHKMQTVYDFSLADRPHVTYVPR